MLEVAVQEASEEKAVVPTQGVDESKAGGPPPDGDEAKNGKGGPDCSFERILVALLGQDSDVETRRTQLASPPPCVDNSDSQTADTLSGIMHAARGGWESFDLVRRMLELDSGGATDARSFTQLLAQAALGGDSRVLNEVEIVIQSAASPPNSLGGSENALARYGLLMDGRFYRE